MDGWRDEHKKKQARKRKSWVAHTHTHTSGFAAKLTNVVTDSVRRSHDSSTGKVMEKNDSREESGKRLDAGEGVRERNAQEKGLKEREREMAEGDDEERFPCSCYLMCDVACSGCGKFRRRKTSMAIACNI